jgi:hypothetical protein
MIYYYASANLSYFVDLSIGENMKRNKKSNLPLYLLVSGGVFLIITALILTSRLPTLSQTFRVTQTSDSHEEDTFPDLPRVSLTDSKTAFDSVTAVFVDVRDTDSYVAGHIPGAFNIPLAELETRLSELDSNQWIITYCT